MASLSESSPHRTLTCSRTETRVTRVLLSFSWQKFKKKRLWTGMLKIDSAHSVVIRLYGSKSFDLTTGFMQVLAPCCLETVSMS